MRVVWELRAAPLTFRALRSACEDISPTALQSRLNELRGAGLVQNIAGRGYALTKEGIDLLGAFAPLHAFAEQWAAKGLIEKEKSPAKVRRARKGERAGTLLISGGRGSG